MITAQELLEMMDSQNAILSPTLNNIKKVVTEWVGNGNKKIKPAYPVLKNTVFRVMSEKEWQNIQDGYYSGDFWSSDPTEYAYNMKNGVLVVAKAQTHYYRNLPDKDLIRQEKQHYQDLDKKELKTMLAVFKKIGTKLEQVYP